MGETDDSMSHQGHAASLGRATEESHLDLLGMEVLRKLRHGAPSCWAACTHVVLHRRQLHAETNVGLDSASEADL
jgi:hypothetical protein